MVSVALLIAVLLVGLAAALVAGMRPGAGVHTGTGAVPVQEAPVAFARARRHAAGVAAAAWGCLVAVVLLVPGLAVDAGSRQGLALAAVPALAGLTFLLVSAAGERTWPRPDGQVRRASLHRRSAADVAPAPLRRTAWAWCAALAVAVVALGLTAAPDGRTVAVDLPLDAVARAAGVERHGGAAGPYPGWAYGVPLLLATLAVITAGEGVLRLVAARPLVAATSERDDARLRRVSARRVLAGTQLVAAGTLGGVLLVAGAAVANVGRPRAWSVGDVAGTAGAPLLVAVGVALAVLGAGVGLAGVAVAATALRRAADDAAAPVTRTGTLA